MQQVLGKFPGKTLHRIAVAIGGFWITGNLVNFIWQDPSRPIYKDLKEQIPISHSKQK
tara:strand:- start:306 stop:479 length:174 start_codon:yes stop_codon:yes gene_type:complete